MLFYKREVINESTSNILFNVFGCIYTGIKYKVKNIRNHRWIDGTLDNYTSSFIEDVCTVLKVSLRRKLIQHVSPKKNRAIIRILHISRY